MVRKRSAATAQRRRCLAGALPDMEGSMILELGLLFFDMADVGEAGSAVEHAGEFGESVGRVEGVAFQVQGRGGVLCEVAVSDALDSALDDPASGGLGRGGHRITD